MSQNSVSHHPDMPSASSSTCNRCLAAIVEEPPVRNSMSKPSSSLHSPSGCPGAATTTDSTAATTTLLTATLLRNHQTRIRTAVGRRDQTNMDQRFTTSTKVTSRTNTIDSITKTKLSSSTKDETRHSSSHHDEEEEDPSYDDVSNWTTTTTTIQKRKRMQCCTSVSSSSSVTRAQHVQRLVDHALQLYCHEEDCGSDWEENKQQQQESENGAAASREDHLYSDSLLLLEKEKKATNEGAVLFSQEISLISASRLNFLELPQDYDLDQDVYRSHGTMSLCSKNCSMDQSLLVSNKSESSSDDKQDPNMTDTACDIANESDYGDYYPEDEWDDGSTFRTTSSHLAFDTSTASSQEQWWFKNPMVQLSLHNEHEEDWWLAGSGGGGGGTGILKTPMLVVVPNPVQIMDDDDNDDDDDVSWMSEDLDSIQYYRRRG